MLFSPDIFICLLNITDVLFVNTPVYKLKRHLNIKGFFLCAKSVKSNAFFRGPNKIRGRCIWAIGWMMKSFILQYSKRDHCTCSTCTLLPTAWTSILRKHYSSALQMEILSTTGGMQRNLGIFFNT
jgi:hypothetical protein